MINSKIKFLESFLGEGSSISRNNDVAFYCPKCNHRKKKLAVNLNTDKKGHWGKYHCWVCGEKFKGKNLISLLKLCGRYSLLKEYIKTINDDKWFTLDTKKTDLSVILPTEFIPVSSYILNNNRNNNLKRAYNYLKSERKLTDIEIISNIFGITTDKNYYGYVIVPSFDKDGELNYFVGRSYTGSKYRYRNCKNAKTNIIFNEINIDWDSDLLITEGPFDCIKSKLNSTCILGSSLTKKSLLFKKIVENKTSIKLALDSDSKGVEKSINIASLLMKYNVSVQIINFDKRYKDIAEMPTDEWLSMYESQKGSSLSETEILKKRIEGMV
tara:strand:+ start:14108 stop:15088 length:981 start_codon:yes stop_codon:yes gene_type:complete